MTKPSKERVTMTKTEQMGMVLDEWRHESCMAQFGTGKDWATLYSIQSREKRKGHATKLLLKAKDYYEKKGKKVGGSVALNPVMKELYKKVGYIEYD